MFIVKDYTIAILFCIITMLCWGSWANTQKLASKQWRFELFYWDYVLGMLLLSFIGAITMGSIGDEGRNFIDDLRQVKFSNLTSAFIGGIIFNAANILLTAAISIAGMAVAFPIGIGLALVLGVILNYEPNISGNPYFLFTGVFLVVIAIILNARAYQIKNKGSIQKSIKKGIIISIVAGLLMSLFYRFVAKSMDLENFIQPEAGKMTPYTAFFIFSLGVFLSNFIFNTIIIYKPFSGSPSSYKAYFNGKLSHHIPGIIGGIIWAVGNLFNLIAAGQAGAAISYGLGQGATMVAAFWGIIVWKEFKGFERETNTLLILMFVLFFVGLASIIYAGN